jgi:nucleoside-diphosphate-sugar epimerase
MSAKSLSIDPQDLPSSPQDVADWYVQKAVSDPLQEAILSLKDKRICILGGCGQVGSHIVAKLYEFGFSADQIVLNDDLRLGKLDNLPPALRDRVDTRSHLEFAQSLPPDIHIAIFVGGRSSAPHFRNLQDVMEEIKTWESVLEWCVRQNVRLIFATTSSLCKTRPSLETQKTWPGSLYELAKAMMEDMAIQQALCNDLKVQICRFFSVYGVTEQHKGEVGNLFTQILWHAISREPFEVWEQSGRFRAGEQTRDIIFAPEVSRAVLYLLKLPDPKPELEDISALTYNIGQGDPISVSKMIDRVGKLLPEGLQPIVQSVEMPSHFKNYVVHTWGNPQKILHAGFKPLFADHGENLTFILHALVAKRDWYWSILGEVRERMTLQRLSSPKA